LWTTRSNDGRGHIDSINGTTLFLPPCRRYYYSTRCQNVFGFVQSGDEREFYRVTRWKTTERKTHSVFFFFRLNEIARAESCAITRPETVTTTFVVARAPSDDNNNVNNHPQRRRSQLSEEPRARPIVCGPCFPRVLNKNYVSFVSRARRLDRVLHFLLLLLFSFVVVFRTFSGRRWVIARVRARR